MELNKAFGLALKQIRSQQGLTQEDFTSVSSRTYLSALERGLKGPTIQKLEQLAGVLNVHPATVLISAFLHKNGGEDYRQLLLRIGTELQTLEQHALGAEGDPGTR
ncbi:helix-turn-helix transcriptional regulator [Pseudomonas sp. PDM15]|jgi:transcriptional regulator with XRE-family HTH domain|uniref:helix-turn-helix domain-containing protein n=1 Tax=Pseudomonas sp. PDM15 TaxID=2769303 RepID=UPI00177F1A56|nr:helix-turn-helix transcriptional regulator [Pseudomonas sp. PDM15]MBD9427635.1 helix-turn-helix transcriptional regulator [Pseudomonas sp. PDM15]